MNNLNTELIQALLANSNIDEIFRQQIESAVNFILERELAAFLDYEKYSIMIENMNNQLKRITKRKEQFPGEAALDKCVCCYYSNCNARSSTRIHRGFGQCQRGLEKLFSEFYPPQTEPTQAEASSVDNRVA